MVDDALLHTRPDGGLGALAIDDVSQYLFRDDARIFRRGVIALSRRVCLSGFLTSFLTSFLPGEYANGIFQRVGRACRGIRCAGGRLCRALRRAGRS